MKPILVSVLSAAALLATGCATQAPKDYTALREAKPRSILVLPPLNEATDIKGGPSVFTTVTRPLSELGYYVFPTAMVEQFLKENGLTVAGEMHAAPLEKLRSVFGTDSVLYIVVEGYGSKYQVLATTTSVKARAKLVDARTGAVLWERQVYVDDGGQGGLVQALMAQVMNSIFDQAHLVAAAATHQMFNQAGQGLLKGPRHPEAGRD